MSEQERESRRAAAQAANPGGEPDSAYWEEIPQLNTVGYLTTTAGALAAGYAVGWITGRFEPPFERLQMNLVARELEVIAWEDETNEKCVCRRVRGWGDQGYAEASVTAPRALAACGSPVGGGPASIPRSYGSTESPVGRVGRVSISVHRLIGIVFWLITRSSSSMLEFWKRKDPAAHGSTALRPSSSNENPYAAASRPSGGISREVKFADRFPIAIT